jgi:hypothetical protein
VSGPSQAERRSTPAVRPWSLFNRLCRSKLAANVEDSEQEQNGPALARIAVITQQSTPGTKRPKKGNSQSSSFFGGGPHGCNIRCTNSIYSSEFDS